MKVLSGGTINTVAGKLFIGSILINDGKIEDMGENIDIPSNAEVIDVKGKTVIPGLIEAHCHTGLREEGEGREGVDQNESSDPITPHIRAIDGIKCDDIGMKEAVKSGITTVNVMPGSANPIGGQSVALKTAGSNIVDELVIKNPTGMKMALGENPKNAHKENGTSTRMGIAGILRKTLWEAQKYLDNNEDNKRDNFVFEALKPLLEKGQKARIHAHRADDMVTAVRIAEEFDLDLVIEHATEGHLIADYLAEKDVPVVIGPSLSPKSKRETSARTLKTADILNKKGVKVALMTDSPVICTKYINLMAAYSVRAGMDTMEALKSITIYAAQICGIDDRVGSLEKGKDADIIVLDGDPLDINSTVEKVFIEGKEISIDMAESL